MIQQSGSLSIVLVDCAELGDLIVCYAHRWLVKPFNKPGFELHTASAILTLRKTSPCVGRCAFRFQAIPIGQARLGRC